MRAKDENKRQAIRDRTIELIVKSGLDGFSMQKLAKAAGVSPATLYIYYKDREDLILQTCLGISNDLFEATIKDFDPDMHFAEGMKIQWRNRADFFMKHPVELEFIEQIRYSPMHEKIREALMNKFGAVLGKFAHNAVTRGELVPHPFEVYWSVAYAPLYQLLKFHTQENSYVHKKFQLTDEMMEQSLQLILKALKP
jgi:TetR/AcrR family transcriptional repressor of multidrug resistance operon